MPGPLLSAIGRIHTLSSEARQELATVLDVLQLDPDRPRFVFGFTAQASAFVVGRRVTLSARRWMALDARRQLALLAHELTHVAQYDALGRGGIPRFLVRYFPEYHLNPDTYRLPTELAALPLPQVDLLDRRYTLDQIAQRFSHEVARG
jgi:hypothetical protein